MTNILCVSTFSTWILKLILVWDTILRKDLIFSAWFVLPAFPFPSCLLVGRDPWETLPATAGQCAAVQGPEALLLSEPGLTIGGVLEPPEELQQGTKDASVSPGKTPLQMVLCFHFLNFMYLFYILCAQMFGLSLVCAPCGCSTSGGQKRASDSPGLEFLKVWATLCAEDLTPASAGAVGAPTRWASTPAPSGSALKKITRSLQQVNEIKSHCPWPQLFFLISLWTSFPWA